MSVRYFVLACDYDGTLAHDGKVAAETIQALERIVASGRKLVMVTGRQLPELLSVFPRCDLFAGIVAENGCLLYWPATQEKKRLADPPPAKFIAALRKREVDPVAFGEVIVATWTPHETAVLEAIHEMGLELQVIFNKGAVMIVPAGVNKATGLSAALQAMGFSAHNVVGVGDAENDHAFLNLCECAVAVANALPTVKEKADFTTTKDHGAGVVELIDELIHNDLQRRDILLARHALVLGSREGGEEIAIRFSGVNALLAGSSGAGKTSAATSILERLSEQRYQFCVIDPEGDYDAFEPAVTLGGPARTPTLEEISNILKNPQENLVVNLVALPFSDRPAFFQKLLSRLQELRAQTGRPHWIVVDEAHHVLPRSREPSSTTFSDQLDRMLYITVEPRSVAGAILSSVDTVVALGDEPDKVIREICDAVGQAPPVMNSVSLDRGEMLVWSTFGESVPVKVKIVPSRSERRRHRRKYAEGDLGPERSFYFRGPLGKLKLKAQNLIMFMQIADGIDDETWIYHLREGDYSAWFRDCIKDEALAAEASRIERVEQLPPAESRNLVKRAISERYTLPGRASSE